MQQGSPGARIADHEYRPLDLFLGDHENEWHVGSVSLLPGGTRLVGVAFVMLVVLVLRPSGLTGGKELSLTRAVRRLVQSRSGPG